MDAEKIQLLLRKNGKTPAIISRDLSVSPSVVSRTINNGVGSSRRVRLYISHVVGYMPSSLFELSLSNQLLEDFIFCSEKTGSSNNSPILS
jgi:hypothetical protein